TSRGPSASRSVNTSERNHRPHPFGQRGNDMKRAGRLHGLTAAVVAASSIVAGAALARPVAMIGESRIFNTAPLLNGDEPIIVSAHTIQSTKGPLTYEARVGRLPIRNAETGEVRGHIFFVAYVIKPKDGAPPRPLTFLWNGGPGAPSSIIHMQGVGPRRIDKDHMVDNPPTLLA